MFLKYFSFLDFFKSVVSLYYNGKTKYSTVFGVFCSFFLIVLLTYQFLNSDLFQRKSPNVIMQTIQSINAEKIQFNINKPLIIGIGDRMTLQKIYDPSIFEVSVIYFENYIPQVIETGLCKLEDLNFNESFFYKLQYDKQICLKKKDFYLEGYADK